MGTTYCSSMLIHTPLGRCGLSITSTIISRVSLIRDIDNRPVQFVVSVEDITQKKQNESKLAAAKLAEAANKAKSEFLAWHL